MPRRDDGRRALAYASALALGLFLCFSTYPVAFLWPMDATAGPFIDDMAQHVVGQRYFIADAWRWPLLIVPALGEPPGAHIGLTDSIPLMAVPLRAIRAWLPVGFQGIGLWYGLTCVLQPVAAVWCLRAAGEKRWVPALAMAVLCASIPAWWDRFPHAALTGQALLLFALGTYHVLLRRQDARAWGGAGLLVAVTLFVHPYLLMMVLALLGAVPLTLLTRRDPGWGRAALAVLVITCGAAAVLAVFGYLGGRGDGGFGRFAMNLLSPLWPAGSWFFGSGRPRIHAEGVSGWEGYNYLGLGLIAALVLALVAARRSAWHSLGRHAGLIIVLLGLGALSLSHRVALGYSRVYEVMPAFGLLEPFRSSARFFWPVSYALVLAAVIGLSRLRGGGLRIAALAGVAALQFADVTPLRQALAAKVAAPPAWRVDAPALRAMMADASSVQILPRYNCLPVNEELARPLLMDVLTLASERALPVNTMYAARWPSTADCQPGEAVPSVPRPGELLVLLPGVGRPHMPPAAVIESACRMVGVLLVCRGERP